MVFTVWKSDEGVEEYKRLNMEYPTHINDQDFESFMTKIEWDPNKSETIIDIIRVKTHTDKEFIVYSSTIRGQDKVLHNYDQRTRSRLGTYMQLEPHTTRTINSNADNPEMSEFVDKVSIGNMTAAYSIPFTKEKLDELHKKCNDKALRANDQSKYYVEKDGQQLISVPTYEDFRDLDFDTLYKFGGPDPDTDTDTTDTPTIVESKAMRKSKD